MVGGNQEGSGRGREGVKKGRQVVWGEGEKGVLGEGIEGWVWCAGGHVV